jgi:hypothetical protein
MEQWGPLIEFGIVKREQIDLGTLSYRTLANDFREEVRPTPTTPRKYVRRTICYAFSMMTTNPEFQSLRSDPVHLQLSMNDGRWILHTLLKYFASQG